MSNTTITPTIGAATLAGVALAMGLGLSPLGGGPSLVGVAPTLTAANVAPAGFPGSWSKLGAGGVGAAIGPLAWQQARFAVTGAFGTYGSLIIQGSNDGLNWTNLAGISDLVLPGYSLNGGPAVYAPGGGLIVLSANDIARFPYLRPVVQNGDGTTSLSVSGNIGPGAV